jgi:hypothetical protein
MSAIEFDEFMKERTRKRLENTPIDAPGVVCGCYFDVPAFKDKNVLVECALCGIPLYVRPWIYEITKTRDLKICCQYCMPPQLLKGTLIQDIAAVLQKTGEK